MVESRHPVVAFQGEHYAFSEIAAIRFFGEGTKCHPCRTFDEIFDSVERGFTKFGIVPIENSLTGSVHRNYDLLLERHLNIGGEVFLKINQQLIANPGVNIKDIKVIYSHPQALEQCRNFLNTLKNTEAIPNYDTAGSVKMIRDKKLLDAAAIASKWAAQDYGMNILQEQIQDIPENYTRFLIVSRQPDSLGDANKTSVVFAVKNIPGALFKCLSVFALRDIDLCKIESRPMRSQPWAYIFYLDFTGNMNNAVSRNAIRHLEEITSYMKVLGSYPAGKIHES